MPNRKAEYRVACGSQIDTMIGEVEEWLNEGFTLAGSMVIEPANLDLPTYYYQPMLRPANQKSTPRPTPRPTPPPVDNR